MLQENSSLITNVRLIGKLNHLNSEMNIISTSKVYCCKRFYIFDLKIKHFRIQVIIFYVISHMNQDRKAKASLGHFGVKFLDIFPGSNTGTVAWGLARNILQFVYQFHNFYASGKCCIERSIPKIFLQYSWY